MPLYILSSSSGLNARCFTSSYEAKTASSSEAPSPSHSERAASAFINLVPPPSPFRLRTFPTRR
ncbi:hypothetical protein COE58_16370 [Bacillus cereus]|nr:hypothetical protein COL13_12085 [Bacillus cereus]PGZ60433.1 hypothetical protein COE58_16370 [Bacillus cereus]